MRIQDFNPVIKEDNEMSDVITARGLVHSALNDPAARQEYFDYMTHLRNKHGKEYSTRIHQKATALAKPVSETIKKVGSQYELVSRTGKNLGKYPTRAGAERREQQVNYFKHKDEIDEDAWTGDNPAWHNGNDQWNDGTDQWHSAGSGDAGVSGATGGAAGPLGGAIPVADTAELEEDFNPTDVVSVDIPLLIRLLEYAREDAKTDMDLHNITERLIALSQEGNTLTMQDYDTICNTKETD
jgi:hypothetical protein